MRLGRNCYDSNRRRCWRGELDAEKDQYVEKVDGVERLMDGEIEVKALDAVAGHMKALGRRLQACT